MIPVDWPVLAGFFGASLLLVLSPGPDTILILRYTIGSGRRVGLATVAGVQVGLLVHTLAAVVGLSLLLATTPIALQAIAGVGAVYLAWLGWQSFRAGVLPVDAPSGGMAVGAVKACRDALLTNLLNPKVVLLFLALMPQFVRQNGWSAASQLAFLGAVLIVVNTIWQAMLALLAGGIKPWLARPRIQRGVSCATGAVLMAFAALMAIDFLLPA